MRSLIIGQPLPEILRGLPWYVDVLVYGFAGLPLGVVLAAFYSLFLGFKPFLTWLASRLTGDQLGAIGVWLIFVGFVIQLLIPGKLVFHIFGALAEFERNLIRDRTQAGLAAARARGRQGGRPKTKSLATPQQIAMLQALYQDKSNSIEQICQTLHISRATLYRYIKGGSS